VNVLSDTVLVKLRDFTISNQADNGPLPPMRRDNGDNHSQLKLAL